MMKFATLIFLTALASPAAADGYVWSRQQQADGEWRYWGNDDYQCSGNHHEIYYYHSQDTRAFEGSACELRGRQISIPVYSQQGWDCDEIFLYEDFQCIDPYAAANLAVDNGTWEPVGDWYWGNDDYECSGNHYPIYYLGGIALREFIGSDCEEIGDLISVPIYSQQGWDCEDIFLFQDFECWQ